MKLSFISTAPLAVLGIAISSAAFAAGSVNLNEPAYGPDKSITRVVQQQISTSMDPTDQVYVATTHNIVALHGFVNDEEQRHKAEQIASSVPGVIGVDNHLVIGRSAND